MQELSLALISGKKILLRADLDIPIENGKIVDDFRLEAWLDTLEFCLEHALSVTIMGHVGRPSGDDPNFSVKPIVDYLEQVYAHIFLPEEKLHVLENLRFEQGEDAQDLSFAMQLAQLGDFYVNEAFAAYHPAASTTLLPTLLPHAAGLRFTKEVKTLTRVKENPSKPLVVIMGGAKVGDKLPVIEAMAKIADHVLVGGKLISELAVDNTSLPSNVLLGKLTEDGQDITEETIKEWAKVIAGAKMIVWNGPLGLVEDPKNDATVKIAQEVTKSGAEAILGGGDTVAVLNKLALLDKFSFVSTGGGAMLKLLTEGTLPTIEALK